MHQVQSLLTVLAYSPTIRRMPMQITNLRSIVSSSSSGVFPSLRRNTLFTHALKFKYTSLAKQVLCRADVRDTSPCACVEKMHQSTVNSSSGSWHSPTHRLSPDASTRERRFIISDVRRLSMLRRISRITRGNLDNASPNGMRSAIYLCKQMYACSRKTI